MRLKKSTAEILLILTVQRYGFFCVWEIPVWWQLFYHRCGIFVGKSTAVALFWAGNGAKWSLWCLLREVFEGA